MTLRLRTHAIERRAITAVFVAVVLWATSSLTVRAAHSDALVFTTWRLWFALPPLFVIVALRKRHNPDLVLRPEGVSRLRWTALVTGAGAMFAAGAASAFAALGLTRILDVTLIAALQPVVIIGLAVMFLGERVDRGTVVRAAVAVLGTALVALAASTSGDWSLAGELMAVVSLFLNVGWYLYGRVLRARYPIDPFGFMLGVLTAAAIVTTPTALLAHGNLDLEPAAYWWAAATMVIGTTAHVLVVWAHRYVPASVSAPMLLAQPPMVAIAAWICFGEAPGIVGIVGCGVVIGALWGMVRDPAVTRVEDETPDPLPPD